MATPTQIRRRGRFGLILGTLVAALMLVAVAYADNLQSDLDTSTGGLDKTVNLGTLPANTGQSQDVFLFVQEQPGATNDPEYPFNVTASKGAASTFPGSIAFTGVTISGSGTANGRTGQVTWTTPAAQAAAQNYSIVVGFDANTTINESPATVTINFSVAAAPPPPSDTTPPSISYVLNPASPDGNNGWYKSNVTLTWTVSEPDSPSSLVKTGCVDQNITADQVEQTYSCSATSDGGSAGPVSVSIKRDATNPTISGAVLPASPDGTNGWYKTAPTVTFTCSDVTSGIASCVADGTSPATASKTLGESALAQSVGGTATDNAGNTNTASVTGLKVDLSDPTVICPAPAPSFVLNQPGTGAVSASVTDTISGALNPAATGDADTSSVGSKNVSITGYDNAGRSKTVSCSYTVGYTFTGLAAPVDRPNTLNVSKAGQAIPLKWRLTDYFGVGVTTLTSASVTVGSLSCVAGAEEAAVEEYASGSSGLQNLGDGYYQFNWKTPTSYANSCKQIGLNLGEGSARNGLAYFNFKK